MPDLVEGLNVPHVDPRPHPKNFIRQAVCELRFPTLLELESRPPTELQTKLRKDYPFYERVHALQVGPGSAETADRYVLRSRDRHWNIGVTPSSVSLDTEHYHDFDAFATRLRRLIEASQELIDTDFFTRVGLRYVNSIPSGARRDDLGEWINRELVAALLEGALGKVSQYWSEIQGSCAGGRYSMRHGFRPSDKGGPAEYVLDFDFYAESVPVDDVRDLIKSFNLQCVDLFHWSVGPKTIAALDGE